MQHNKIKQTNKDTRGKQVVKISPTFSDMATAVGSYFVIHICFVKSMFGSIWIILLY